MTLKSGKELSGVYCVRLLRGNLLWLRSLLLGFSLLIMGYQDHRFMSEYLVIYCFIIGSKSLHYFENVFYDF